MQLQRGPVSTDLMLMPARRLCKVLLRMQARPSLGGLTLVHEKHMMYTAAVAAQPLGTEAEPGRRLADATPGFAALGLDDRVLVSISQRHPGEMHVLQSPWASCTAGCHVRSGTSHAHACTGSSNPCAALWQECCHPVIHRLWQGERLPL